MNMIDTFRALREEEIISMPVNVSAQCVAQRLDELTGHTKLLKACKAVVLFDKIAGKCCYCFGCDKHDNGCPIPLCEAAIADADK